MAILFGAFRPLLNKLFCPVPLRTPEFQAYAVQSADPMLDESVHSIVTPSTWKRVYSILSETYDEWDRDNASSLAAALAYYAAFATAPLLVLLVAVLGSVLGRATVRAEVLRQASMAIGPDGVSAVTLLLDNAAHPGSSTLAVIVGVATLLITTSGLFFEFSRSLEIVWNAPPRTSTSKLQFLKDRVVPFVMVLAGAAFLLISMVTSALLGALSDKLEHLGPGVPTLIHFANLLVSFVGVTALFAISFKMFSRADISWRNVGGGALFTAVLFSLGKYLIALYFARAALASSFGAAGSFAVYLAWVYYTAQIFFLGAELTQVWNRHLCEPALAASATTSK